MTPKDSFYKLTHILLIFDSYYISWNDFHRLQLIIDLYFILNVIRHQIIFCNLTVYYKIIHFIIFFRIYLLVMLLNNDDRNKKGRCVLLYNFSYIETHRPYLTIVNFIYFCKWQNNKLNRYHNKKNIKNKCLYV